MMMMVMWYKYLHLRFFICSASIFDIFWGISFIKILIKLFVSDLLLINIQRQIQRKWPLKQNTINSIKINKKFSFYVKSMNHELSVTSTISKRNV